MASDALGEAYVVPFDKILLDIKHSLGAVSICLPTRSEISAWHRGSHVDLRNNRLPASTIHSPPNVDSGYVSYQVTPTYNDEDDFCTPEDEELEPVGEKGTSGSIEPELDWDSFEFPLYVKPKGN